MEWLVTAGTQGAAVLVGCCWDRESFKQETVAYLHIPPLIRDKLLPAPSHFLFVGFREMGKSFGLALGLTQSSENSMGIFPLTLLSIGADTLLTVMLEIPLVIYFSRLS